MHLVVIHRASAGTRQEPAHTCRAIHSRPARTGPGRANLFWMRSATRGLHMDWAILAIDCLARRIGPSMGSGRIFPARFGAAIEAPKPPDEIVDAFRSLGFFYACDFFLAAGGSWMCDRLFDAQMTQVSGGESIGTSIARLRRRLLSSPHSQVDLVPDGACRRRERGGGDEKARSWFEILCSRDEGMSGSPALGRACCRHWRAPLCEQEDTRRHEPRQARGLRAREGF